MKSLILFSFLFFLSCQTTAPLSSDQRRTLQVRTFSSTSYNTVFRAFKTVMQDEGYIVKNQDFEGGLIVAESQKSESSGNIFVMGVIGGLTSSHPNDNHYRTGQIFSWSVNLEQIQKNAIEARIILQQKDLYSSGSQSGREILDPQIYQNIYAKVNREIQRRKALKLK